MVKIYVSFVSSSLSNFMFMFMVHSNMRTRELNLLNRHMQQGKREGSHGISRIFSEQMTSRPGAGAGAGAGI